VKQPCHRRLVFLQCYFSIAPQECSNQTKYRSLKALSEFRLQSVAFFHLKSNLQLRHENHIVSGI
jgi:hypothetical protein